MAKQPVPPDEPHRPRPPRQELPPDLQPDDDEDEGEGEDEPIPDPEEQPELT